MMNWEYENCFRFALVTDLFEGLVAICVQFSVFVAFISLPVVTVFGH